MDHNIALNATYEFDGYLVCKMPADTVEMELKINTRSGRYTLPKIPTLEQRGIVHGKGWIRGQKSTPGEAKER